MPALRLLVTSIVLALLVGLAPAAAAPPAAPVRAKAATTLTAALAEKTVDYGSAAVVAGTLTKSAAGTGVKGQPVTLHGRRTGTTSWTQLEVTSTRTGGAYRFTVPDRTANYDFQARFAGTATLAADSSPVVALRVRAPLTGVQVDPPGPNAIVGDVRTWTAATLSTLNNTQVTLQSAQPGGIWNYENSGFVRRDGSIELSTTLYTEGVRDYRLQLGSSSRLVGTTSDPVRITTRKLAISTTALPEATVQLPYEVALQTTGADEPVIFSVDPVRLPDGITLSQAGVLSGRPTTLGTKTFTVQAYDERGQFAQRRLTLAVTEPTAPVLADAVLPGAQLGVGYAYQPLRVGGTAPFTWTLTAGALPAGLRLNTSTGLIAGTPTTRETTSVTLRVADADGDATSATWPLPVGPAADWAQSGAGAARSGFNPAESTLTAQTADRARLEWTLPGGHSDVVAAGGVVYTGSAIPGSTEQGITARDLASGAVLWTRPVTDANGSSPGCQRLAVTGQSVLCDTGSEVFAVARGGAHQVRWSTAQTNPGVQSRDLLVAGDRVLVAGYDRTVTAYGLADGQLLWARPISGDLMGMAVGDGTVYVLSSDGISTPLLQTFSLAGTGTPGWAKSVAGANFALVAVPGAVVVTAGRVAQWRSASNGAVLRSYESPVPIFGTPIADNRRLYLPTSQFDEWGGWSGTGVTAVGLADARRKWSVDTGYPIRAGTALGADVLWVHASDLGRYRIPSEVLAVRTTDGRVLRRYAPGDTGFAPPVVAGGRAVIRTAYSADVLGVMAAAVRVPEAVLPVGWTGTAYRTRLTAEQGRAPYRWQVVGGALPAGLSLSPGGVLTGTPTAAGAASVRVRATDANGRSATQQFGVAVRTVSTTAWPTLGGDAARGGLAAGEAGITADTVAAFALRWSTPEIPVPIGYPPGYFAEEPLAVGNRVFGLGGDGLLRAWNSGGGLNTAPLWTTTLPDDETVVGTPTLAGFAATGTLYAVTTRGRLLAVRAATGTVAWSTPLLTDPFDAIDETAQISPTVVGGLVVVQTGDEVTAVRTGTHAVAWSEPLTTGDRYDLFAPTTDGSRIFVYSRCAVVALDPADGSQLWRSTVAAPTSRCDRVVATYGNQERVAPVVDDGVVYANGIYDGAAAFDAATGAVRWRARLASSTPAPVVTEHWLVFAYGYDDTLTVVDKATGTIVATGSGYEVNSSLTVAGDLVLFRSNESRIRAVDLTTMQSVWTSSSLDPASGWFYNAGPVAVSGGRVYAYTGHAKLVGFGGPG